MMPIRAFHPLTRALAAASLSLLAACGGGDGDSSTGATSTAAADAAATGSTAVGASSGTPSGTSAGTTTGAGTGATSSSPATSASPAASGSQAAPTGAALTCDITHYTAGAVRVPTADELARYAGTYDGDEGVFGPNIGDPFIKSGSARVVLNTDLSFTYKGVAYSVTSVCIDKAVNGAGGTFMYVEAGAATIDFTDAGTAHGFSPANTNILFQNGKKQ